MYKTYLLTGLRKNELATLTVGQLELDRDPAFLILDAADEKSREGNSVAIRSDLADDLRKWLADKASVAQEAHSEAQTIKFDPAAAKGAKGYSSGGRPLNGSHL